MEILAAEFYWVIPLAVFIGTAFAVYNGYSKKGNGSRQIHNSAIIDSAVGEAIVRELKRIADVGEDVREQMYKTAQTEDIRAVIAAELRAELARQKKS